MAIKTQGTELYYANAAATVANIASVVTMSGLDAGANDQIDTTRLVDSARSFISGLANPGALTIELLFDPTADTSVSALYDLKASGASKSWCIGLADGTTDPTASGSVCIAPATRTSIIFDGYVSGFVIDTPQNDVVKATVTIQTSGNHTLTEYA